MTDLLITGVDEAVLEKLTQRSAARGVSLEDHLRNLLTAEALSYQEHLARLAALRDMQPAQTTDSTTMLRDLRDGALDLDDEDARAA
jgi:plasmid stability protein